MNKRYFIGLIVISFFLAGCVAGLTKDIEIETAADPKAKFSGYKSYAWYGAAAILNDPRGQWEPADFDADTEIEFQIDAQLRKHGLVEKSVNPDMFVAYAAGIDMEALREKVDPKTQIRTLVNVPEGALVITLIDAETELVIWAGIATADIQENVSSDHARKRIAYAVANMFKELPK